MISESQERMAAVVEPAQPAAVEAVCAKLGPACTVIGSVIDGDAMICRFDGDVVGEIPVASLVDNCPRYQIDAGAARAPGDRPVDPAATRRPTSSAPHC